MVFTLNSQFRLQLPNFFLISLLLLLSAVQLCADNPFFNGKPNTSQPAATESSTPHFAKTIKQTFITWQQELRTALYKQKQQAHTPQGFFVLCLIAFLYGLLHALGPGHGKIFVTGYFVSQKGNIRKGIFSGFCIGLLHAFSALITVILFYYILDIAVIRNSEAIRSTLLPISYSIMILVALVLFFREFSKKKEKHNTPKSLLGLILSVGCIPCPGAIIIAMFGISALQNIFLAGIMVFSMGIGMSIIISLFSLLPIIARNIHLPFLQSQTFSRIASLIGACCIFIFATLMLVGSC